MAMSKQRRALAAALEVLDRADMNGLPGLTPAYAAEPVGYISGWINGHLTIRLLDPALALSTGTALFLQPPTVPPAISEPAQAVPGKCEPVAEVLWYEPMLHEPQTKKGHKIIDASLSWMEKAPLGTKLYTAPPAIDDETKPLTDEHIDNLLVAHGKGDDGFHSFARAIEKAHGIKEGK